MMKQYNTDAPSPRRPNIILLVGEDTGLHLGCFGNAYAHTPRLDRFAEQGRRFTRAFTTAPVCSPSRCSLVTGRYPWAIGTHHHRSRLLDPPRLLTHDLRDAGYYVNWENKTDFNFKPPDDFADDTRPWLSDLASGELPDQPFFLYSNFFVTHESTMWRLDHFGGACRERIAQEHRLPPDHRHDPADAPVPAYLPDVPEVRSDIARYFDALSIQDAQIGDVLDALDASPYADNTYVIYLTDHGRGLIREKRWCYEAGVHLPLIVRGPGIAPGEISDNLVSWVDLAPTILQLAGAAVRDELDGRDFLNPASTPPRSHAFFGRGRLDETYDDVRGVRDERYLYLRNRLPDYPYAQPNVYEKLQLTTQVMRELHARGQLHGPAASWLAETKPCEELYDTRADPDCVCNLAGHDEHADTLAGLRRALDEHLESVDDLGRVPEQELIDRGLVADLLAGLRERGEPLREPFTVGRCGDGVLEMPGGGA